MAGDIAMNDMDIDFDFDDPEIARLQAEAEAINAVRLPDPEEVAVSTNTAYSARRDAGH